MVDFLKLWAIFLILFIVIAAVLIVFPLYLSEHLSVWAPLGYYVVLGTGLFALAISQSE